MKTLRAALWVAGTTIGSSMLGLPLALAGNGVLTCAGLLLLTYLWMTTSALMLVEVVLWLGAGTTKDLNFQTLCDHTLGRSTSRLFAFVYVGLLVLLLASYWIALSSWLVQWLPALAAHRGSLFTAFAVAGYGALRADLQRLSSLNSVLMVLLLASFAVLCSVCLGTTRQAAVLQSPSWHLALSPATLGVLVTAFGFHIIIPSLARQLDYDARSLRWAVVGGGGLPLLLYSVWVGCVFARVDPAELRAVGATGGNIFDAFAGQGAHLSPLGHGALALFSGSAVLTSLLGVSVSGFDFWRDALPRSLSGPGPRQAGAAVLVSVLPLAVTLLYPEQFLELLAICGVYGVMTLLVLMPGIMVWRGRYQLGLVGPHCLPLGRGAIAAMLLLTAAVICWDLVAPHQKLVLGSAAPATFPARDVASRD